MRWPTRKGKALAKGTENETLTAGFKGQDDDCENSKTNGNFAVPENGDDRRNGAEVEGAKDGLSVHDRDGHVAQQVGAVVPSKEANEGGDEGDDRQHHDPDGGQSGEQRGGKAGDAIAPGGISVHAKSKSAADSMSSRVSSLRNRFHWNRGKNKTNDAGKGYDDHEGEVAADGDGPGNDLSSGDEDDDDDKIVNEDQDRIKYEKEMKPTGFKKLPKFAGSRFESWCYWALFWLVLITCLAYLFWWAFVWVWPAFDCDGAVAPPTECTQGLGQIAAASGQNRFLWLGECTDLSRLEHLLQNADKITARTFASQIFDPRTPDTLLSWDSWRDGSLYEVASCYDCETRILMFIGIGLGLVVFIALSWLGETLHDEKEAQLYRPILNVAMVYLTMHDFADLSADSFEKYVLSFREIDAVERYHGESHWIMKFAAKPYAFLKDTAFGLTYTTNAFRDLRDAHFGDDDASRDSRNAGTAKVFRFAPAAFVVQKRELENIDKRLQSLDRNLQEATKQFADQSEGLLSALDKVTEGLDRNGDVDEDTLHDAQVPMDDLFEKMNELKEERKTLMERRRGIEQKLQEVTGQDEGKKAAYYAVEMMFFAFTMVNRRELYWRRPPGQPDASDAGSGPLSRLRRRIWFPRFSCWSVTDWFWRLVRCEWARSKCRPGSSSPCCHALCACSRPKWCSFKGCVNGILSILGADGAEKKTEDPKGEAYPLLEKYNTKEMLSNYVQEVLTKWAVSAYIFWFSALSALAICIGLVCLYVWGQVIMSEWPGTTRYGNCTRLSDLLPSQVSFAGRCIDYDTLYNLLVEVEEADFTHGPFYSMPESVLLIDDKPVDFLTRAYAQMHLCAAHPHRKFWAVAKAIAIAVAMVSWFGYFIFSRRAVRWFFLPFIREGYDVGVKYACYTTRRLWKGLCWLGRTFLTCISGLWSGICIVIRHGNAVCRDQRSLCSFKRTFPDDEGEGDVDTDDDGDDGDDTDDDDDNDDDTDDNDDDTDDNGADYDDEDDDDGSQQGENASSSSASMLHPPLPPAGSSGNNSSIGNFRKRLPRWPSSPVNKKAYSEDHSRTAKSGEKNTERKEKSKAAIDYMRGIVLAKRFSRQGFELVVLSVMLMCFSVVFCTVFAVSVTPILFLSSVSTPTMVGLATSIMSGEFGLLLVILVVLAVVVPLVLFLRANWRCALSISPGRCRACAEKHHRYRFWKSCQTHYCKTHEFFKSDGNACPACESNEPLCDCSGRNKKLRQDCDVCFCVKHQLIKTRDVPGQERDPAREKLCLICTDPCPQHELVYRLDCEDCYCQRENHKGEPLRSDKRGCAKCFCQSNPDHRDVKLDVLTGLCPECTCAHHVDRSECEVCWCEIHDRATSVVCWDCNSTHLGSHKPECETKELDTADPKADRICMNCSYGCNACRADGVRKEDVCWEEECTLHWCSKHARFGRPDSNGKCECEVCVDPCPFCINLGVPDDEMMHARTECHGPPEGPRRGHYCVEHQREAPENDGRCIVCNGEPTCHHVHEGEDRILTRQECARHDDAHWCFGEMHKKTNEGLVETDGGVDLVEANGQCPVCADPCEECPSDRKRAKTMCASHYCAAHARYRVKGNFGFWRCAACEDPCPECKQKLSQQDIEDRGSGDTKAPKADECEDHYCSKHKRRVNLGRAETSVRDDGQCLLCTDPCTCGHSVPAQECEKCYCIEHKRFLCASDRCADGYCDLCICSYCKRRRDKDEKPIHGRCIRCKGWCDHDVDLETCDQCFCSKHGQPRLMRKQPVLDGAKPEVLPCLRCISCEHEGEDFWSAGEEEEMRGEHSNEGYIGKCSRCYCRHQRDDHPPAYCDHLLTRACQSTDSAWVRVCTRCSVVPLPLTKTRFCKFAAKLHNCLALTNKLPENLMREYWPARRKWGPFSPGKDLGRLSWRDLEEHVSFRYATRERAAVSIWSGGREVNSSKRGDQCAFAVRVAIHALEEQFEVVNLATGERAKLIQFEEKEGDTSRENSRRSEDQGDANGPGRDTNRWHPWFWAGSDESPSLSTYRYGAVEAGSHFLEGRKLDDIFRAGSLWDASSDRRWWPDGSNGDARWKSSDSWYAHDPMTDVLTEGDIERLAAVAVDLKDSVEAMRYPRCVTYFSEENQLGFLVQDPAQQAMGALQSTSVELLTEKVREAEEGPRKYRERMSKNQKSKDANSKSYQEIQEENEQDAKVHADAERFWGMGLTPYVPPALRPLRRDTQLSPRGTFASGQSQLNARALLGSRHSLWKSERLRTTRSTSGSIGSPSEGRRRRTWAAVLRSISGRTLRDDGENSDDEVEDDDREY